MSKNRELLRPFDLEAAKRGEPICWSHLDWNVVFIGAATDGQVAYECDGDVGFSRYPEDSFRMKPLCWVEDRPVYKDDVLWNKLCPKYRYDAIPPNPAKVRIMEKVRELFNPEAEREMRYLCLILQYDIPRQIEFEYCEQALRELRAEITMWVKPGFPGAAIECSIDPEDELPRWEAEKRGDEIRRLMIDALIAKYSGLEYEFPDISKWSVQ